MARSSNNMMRHAWAGRQTYLLSGAEPVVDLGAIRSAIPAMARGKDNPLLRYSLSSAYLDLAQHPDTPAEDRVGAVRKAQQHLGVLSVAGMTEAPNDTEDYNIGLKADLQRAYLPKIHKHVEGAEALGPDDELKLYTNLLWLGQSTLRQTNLIEQQQPLNIEQVKDLAGAKSELSLHLLNARSNIRQETTRGAWPSIERQDRGQAATRLDEREFRTGWDMAVSDGEFWDPTADSVHRIQVKSSARRRSTITPPPYHPDITVIRVKEDIGAPAPTILEDALVEAYQSGEPFEAAQRRLDEYQSNFAELIV